MWFFGVQGKIDDADLAPLKQRNVIDWPDNDDAGYKAAQKVAAALPGSYRILRVDHAIKATRPTSQLRTPRRGLPTI